MLKAADDELDPLRGDARPGRLPDVRAFQVYLRGVTDKSPDLRKASSAAIGAIRDQAEPVLEQLAARRELAPGRSARAAEDLQLAPADPRLARDGAVPVQRPAAGPARRPVDLTATAPAPTGTRWPGSRPGRGRGRGGRPGQGTVGNGDCSAFAYAELESPTARPAQIGRWLRRHPDRLAQRQGSLQVQRQPGLRARGRPVRRQPEEGQEPLAGQVRQRRRPLGVLGRRDRHGRSRFPQGPRDRRLRPRPLPVRRP